MPFEPAPFFDEITSAPPGGRVFWRRAADGVRLRLGVWPAAEGVPPAGTILLLNGRTEYLEKYGQTIADFTARGYAVISLDWRGQGLSDRLLDDPLIGHVEHLSDYQLDMAELTTAARALDLPQPWFVIGHSMGGAIGLRALHEGLEASAAAFSAPMWGIRFAPWQKPFAGMIAKASHIPALARLYAPGTGPDSYVATAPFEDNLLTTDPEMFAMMKRQLAAHPEFALGGPSLGWLRAALDETRALGALAPPPLPALTFLGTNERIVDVKSVVDLVQRWPEARLDMIPGAEHEVLMETEKTRNHVHQLIDNLFRESAKLPARKTA